jgi:hypothetical protein
VRKNLKISGIVNFVTITVILMTTWINWTQTLRTGHLTIMGVREQDWDVVKNVVDQCKVDSTDGIRKCVPSFGENRI